MSINLFSNDTLQLLCSPSRLKPQCCDEDVDKNSKEHKNSCCVIHCVKSRLFLNIIQVILHWREQEKTHRYINEITAEYFQRDKLTNEDEQEANNDLHWDGQRDQSDERNVEAVLCSWMQHCLQLRGVGHQKSHIQHALRCTLLSSVMIHVEAALCVPCAGSLTGSEHYIKILLNTFQTFNIFYPPPTHTRYLCI